MFCQSCCDLEDIHKLTFGLKAGHKPSQTGPNTKKCNSEKIVDVKIFDIYYI